MTEQVNAEIAPPNMPPIADPGGPYSGVVGTAVQLDASGSFDADGDVLSFLWDFGDGSMPSPDAVTTHTYASAGVYTAVVTVSDGVNDPVSSQVNVEISDDTEPPLPTGDSWDVRLPLLAAEGTVEFDEFAGFLFVKETFADCGGTVHGIGFNEGPLTLWMDSKGAIFMGNQDGDTMVGLVFNFMGNTNSIWFAEAISVGQSNDLLGGLLDFFK